MRGNQVICFFEGEELKHQSADGRIIAYIFVKQVRVQGRRYAIRLIRKLSHEINNSIA
jgi:hypothetical protein